MYLATDLDREGEAIAWHVAEAAEIPLAKQRRVTFSEITEPAIREAFANPRDIDMHLVDAQQARRVVDRLVGYTLSPLLARKVRGGLSAGRVQSVAVRLVVEREREVDGLRRPRVLDAPGAAADPRWRRRSRRTWCASTARRSMSPDGETAAAPRRRHPGHRPGREQGQRPAAEALAGGAVHDQHPPAGGQPQARLQPRRTMSVAQRLYEGIEVDGESVGLTTYMRTDSTSMAGVAMGEAREVIGGRFGAEYTMPKGRVYKTKAKGAQEAHEAIRPTSFQRDPDSLARWLSSEELRLYRLIWQRAIASQMTEKRLETTSVELDRGPLRAARIGHADAVRRLLAGLHRGSRRRHRGGRRAGRPAGPGRGAGRRA